MGQIHIPLWFDVSHIYIYIQLDVRPKKRSRPADWYPPQRPNSMVPQAGPQATPPPDGGPPRGSPVPCNVASSVSASVQVQERIF